MPTITITADGLDLLQAELERMSDPAELYSHIQQVQRDAVARLSAVTGGKGIVGECWEVTDASSSGFNTNYTLANTFPGYTQRGWKAAHVSADQIISFLEFGTPPHSMWKEKYPPYLNIEGHHVYRKSNAYGASLGEVNHPGTAAKHLVSNEATWTEDELVAAIESHFNFGSDIEGPASPPPMGGYVSGGISYTQSQVSTWSRDVPIEVSVAKLDKAWSKDSLYFEHGSQAGLAEGTTTLEMPTIYYDPASHRVAYTDGRHRTAAIRESGRKSMFVAARRYQADIVRKALGF